MGFKVVFSKKRAIKTFFGTVLNFSMGVKILRIYLARLSSAFYKNIKTEVHLDCNSILIRIKLVLVVVNFLK